VTLSRDKDRLATIAAVTAAFEGTSLEGGISLHEASEIDLYGTDEDRSAARLLDTECRWQEVPDRDIEEEYTALHFLDRVGFRYYLPAYLVYALRYHDDAERVRGGNSIDYTLAALVLTDDGIAYHKLARFGVLSDEQVAAVRAFLRYMAVHGADYADDARRALEAYWERPGRE
jgi:hypothetical protein